MNQPAKAYDPSSYSDGITSEINRLKNLSRLGWSKESRALLNFGLKEDMHVLEVASGPGFFSENLIELLPNGKLTCLEIEERYVTYAKEHLRQKGANLQIDQGSVLDMPYADNTFDCAVARLIFHHLSDPAKAMSELIRVLKPGGKLIISDYDAKTAHMLSPNIPGAELVHEKAVHAHAARGGDAYVGRKLWPLMNNTNLTKVDIEAIVMHSGEEGLDACKTQFDPTRLLPLVRAGVISEDEYSLYANGVAAFLDAPDSFYMNILIMACGSKSLVAVVA